MRARLKSLRSEEIADLPRWAPPDPLEFAVPLVLEVGVLGQKGRERFDLLVATPAWLRRRHGKHGMVVGRDLLLVFEWSYQRLHAFLAREVERCTGETWPEVARQVGRIAAWEGGEEPVVGLK